jgi:hypothetical protein
MLNNIHSVQYRSPTVSFGGLADKTQNESKSEDTGFATFTRTPHAESPLTGSNNDERSLD